MLAGNVRADDKMASEYNLEGGATLHLVLALRGGGFEVKSGAGMAGLWEAWGLLCWIDGCSRLLDIAK